MSWFTWFCCCRYKICTRQGLPDTLANISEWMRNQLRSDRLTGALSDVHQLTEKWPHLSSLIPTPPPHSILQHFRSFHSVCHLLSACPSIHPGSMFSLLSGSGINLRSGFHFNSGLLTGEVLHLCKWVHQAAGVIRVSRHGDRLPVSHADIQSCSLFRQSCGNGLWGDGLRDPPLLSEEFLENAFEAPGG